MAPTKVAELGGRKCGYEKSFCIIYIILSSMSFFSVHPAYDPHNSKEISDWK